MAGRISVCWNKSIMFEDNSFGRPQFKEIEIIWVTGNKVFKVKEL